MNQLTTEEKKAINQISQQRDYDVTLGNILDTFIHESITRGTPVVPHFAQAILDITGVVIDQDRVNIGSIGYYFSAVSTPRANDATHVTIDILSHTSRAIGTLTMDVQPTAGDTFTIGGDEVYTFVAIGNDTEAGKISVGADLAAAKANLVAAINGEDEHNYGSSYVFASNFIENVCTLTALIGGVAGNAIGTTETFTATTNVFAAATLSGGSDCSAANAAAALITAINTYDTVGVGALAGTGTKVILKADVAGVAGNAITVSESMTNAAFDGAATNLSGGVDPNPDTDRTGRKIMYDDNYLYICTGGIDDWHRISLGAAL